MKRPGTRSRDAKAANAQNRLTTGQARRCGTRRGKTLHGGHHRLHDQAQSGRDGPFAACHGFAQAVAQVQGHAHRPHQDHQ